jgi:DNA-binding NarL/FixJ family response regulator
MDPSQIEVLIADDHNIFSEGLRLLLRNAGLEVVGVASSGRSAVELTQELQPDVVLLDIRMPDMNGIQSLAAIKASRPKTTVIMLTSMKDLDFLARAIALGAAGYLLKETNPKQIPTIIKAVINGEAIVDQELLQAALSADKHATVDPDIADKSRGEDLTDKEIRVLQLMAQGLDNDTIAEALFISRNTVKSHVMSIFRKLEVSNRTQAAIWAIRNRLTD